MRARQRRAPSTGRRPSYEASKASWLANNPNCTAAEYQQAMTRIARECGV